jgi:hypothetical protein
MKRVWSILGWMTLVVALILGATIAALWLALPLEGTTISIDGETFSLANLSGGELALAFVAAVLASLLALAIGALAAVLGLAAGAIGIGLGILAAVAALALVASPFLLIGWLVWRAVRGPRAVATTTAA